MINALKAAGISQATINMVPAIVDTCRECRAWKPPGNQTVPSVTISTRFNQHVECDLMFYKQHVIMHFICRATRWHAAGEVASKEKSVLGGPIYHLDYAPWPDGDHVL